MSDEYCTRMVRKHKAALTRAENSKDPKRKWAAAVAALSEFESTSIWPDNWTLWQRAKDDAEFELRMANESWEKKGRQI